MADANTIIDQLTADPDFLQLSEADQDQMVEELVGQSTPRQPFARAVSDIALRPVQSLAKGALFGVPERLKPTVGAAGGTLAGTATRIPFGGYAGGVVGQAVGELAKQQPQGSPLDVATGGLATASTISGVRSLGRGARTLFSRQGREQLAQRVLKAPGKFKRVAGRKFGQGLKQIRGTVDLTDEVTTLQNAALETPHGWRLFEAAQRSLPKPLQEILNGTRSATTLSVADATHLRQAVNTIPAISRELGRNVPEYLNLERPFVEFATQTGKKMAQLPGKRALDVGYSTALRDVERVQPFMSRERQLAYGGTPIFRRGTGKLLPDLRATGASGRIFSSKLKGDIRDVRNVKRVGAALTGFAIQPFIPQFIRELPGRGLGGSK